jgi:hypothetical protein
MKINGFVELDSKWVDTRCQQILLRIKVKRQEYKSEMINDYISNYFERNFLQKLFNIKKKPINTSEAWQRMEKEAAKDFFASSPQYWVDCFYSEREKDILEICRACNTAEKIFVNTQIARLLEIGEDF